MNHVLVVVVRNLKNVVEDNNSIMNILNLWSEWGPSIDIDQYNLHKPQLDSLVEP